MRRKFCCILLTLAMVVTMMPAISFAADGGIVYKNGDYVAQKISNPTKGEGVADGFEPGGDRMNSYAWCMEKLGDYIYIGCNRDILYQCVTAITQQMPFDQKLIDGLCKAVTNDEIPVPEAGTNLYTPSIFRYNIKTEKLDVYFDTTQHPEYGVILGFRGAKAFNGAIYMNSQQMDLKTMSAVSGLYRITNDSELPEVVYDVNGDPVGGGGNLRAMTLSEDGKELVMGGTEAVNKGEEYTFKPVVYQTTDGVNFNKVADFEDSIFRPYINKDPLYFDGGADVLDVAQYHGEYYLSVYTKKGALVFKGHPAKDGESGNKYGWVWTEFVGDHGGKYDIGFVDSAATKGASPYVFNDHLYFLTFSDCFGPMTDAVVGYLMCALYAQNDNPDINVLFEAFRSMEASLENQTSVYRMNSDEKIEMVVGDKEKCAGTDIAYVGKLGAGFNGLKSDTTVYNWRAAVYNGKLYIGTFDAYSLFKYATKLTNGDLLNMNSEKFRQQLEYVRTVIESLETAGGEEPEAGAQSTEDFDKLINILIDLQQNLDKQATVEYIHTLLKSVPDTIAALENISKTLETAIEKDPSSKESLEKALKIVQELIKIWQGDINEEGLNRYVRISETLAKHKDAGFELYSTKDGINYETVTLNGFKDKYNYGVRTLVPTDKGLFLGTANPFYGAQLWKITDGDETKEEKPAPKKRDVLLLSAKTSASRTAKLSWTAVKGATKYVVYGQHCGYKYKKLKTVTGRTLTVKSISGKKLKSHHSYRFYVVAYKGSKKIATSKTIHFIVGTTMGSYANVRTVNPKFSWISLKKGASRKIGATYKVYYGKKHLKSTHGTALRYISNCPTVATVSTTGVVKAKAKGTATIYIQDIGGRYCKTSVTVK